MTSSPSTAQPPRPWPGLPPAPPDGEQPASSQRIPFPSRGRRTTAAARRGCRFSPSEEGAEPRSAPSSRPSSATTPPAPAPAATAAARPRRPAPSTVRAVPPPLLLLLLLLAHLPTQTSATRHNFVTKSDGRHFVGPIGIPYGFNSGGRYNLTVFDFELTVGHRNHGHKRGKDEDGEITRKVLEGVEAGFLLKRFRTESDFATFYETVLDDHTMCSYGTFRTTAARAGKGGEGTNDPLLADDDEYGPLPSTDDPSDAGIFLSMKDRDRTWKPNTPSVEHTFQAGEEGLYFLMYQLCPIEESEGGVDAYRHFGEVRSTFELDLHFLNYDEFGNPSYLTAGEMYLPRVFLYFSVSYIICLVVWVKNIQTSGGIGGPKGGAGAGRPKVLPIHHMMTALLVLKTLSTLTESIRYHYIRVTGHAEFWSAVYYTFAFLKGTFLFTVILLIGSGWSFVKPFLNEREKKIVALVLVLQVVDNVAVVVLNAETEGEKLYADWSAVLHLVDILCCCAVLVPIVWSVNALERSVEGQGQQGGGGGGAAADNGAEKGEGGARGGGSGSGSGSGGGEDDEKTLQKLKLFRSFYLLVVAYVYFTRIIVYLFATLLDYRHTWLRYFVTELGTLAFYTVVGIKFRPMVENPYFAVKKDDCDDDADGGGRAVEMGKVGDKA